MFKQSTPDDFWKNVAPPDENGCRLWTGYIPPHGYGFLTYQGKGWLAHRLAWMLRHGPIPDGVCILHTCDRRPCCEDAHHFLGTKGDNNRDRNQKGRDCRGRRVHRTVITEDQVCEIRERLEFDSCANVARVFGVSYQVVYYLMKGQTWKHVKCPT